MATKRDPYLETFKHAQLRGLRDVEALEREPLESRIWSWNVNEWLRRGCALDPEKVAIYFVEDGDPQAAAAETTYAELRRRAIQAANLFRSLGVGAGDAVLILIPTVPQLYAALLGALEAGIACCANWMLGPEQLREIARSSRARVVVALGPTPGYDIWEKVEAIRGALEAPVRVLSVRALAATAAAGEDFDALSAGQPRDALAFRRSVRADEAAAYVHSGGTTGSPKLVKITHRGLCYKCWANTVVVAHVPEDRIFADYPMFHIAGVFGRGILPVADGMSIVIASALGARDRKFIANYWKFVERFGISVLSGVPTTLSVLAKNPPRGEDLRSLRPYMSTGSTSLPVEVAREIERATGVRVLLTYGATEYTQNATQAPRDGETRYGSAGIRLPYTEVRTVQLDAHGRIARECAPDEIGAVLLKGPGITPGYVDPADDGGRFLAHGWFNSGDLGRIDSDGYLWITGRSKDVIIRGGHNIEPRMIEDALLQHPAVLLAAAVSRPDAYAGEVPVAYVQLVSGSQASEEELAAFVGERIAERAAVPREIHRIAEMPLTDVGKPAKAVLRRDAARRAFTGAIAAAVGAQARISVEVAADETHGSMAVIRAQRSAGAVSGDLEARIGAVMAEFATAWRIEWT